VRFDLTFPIANLLRLVLRKSLFLATVFVLAGTAIFFAVRAVPGDPVALRLKNPDPVRVAEERARLGLDRPLVVQWGKYLYSFVEGDWGRSLLTGRLVARDLRDFFPATMELSIVALGIGVTIGVGMAFGAEVFRISWIKKISSLVGTLGLTVPIFIIGLLSLIIGSLWLGWFPTNGRFALTAAAPPVRTGFLLVDTVLAGDIRALAIAVNHLMLPSLCLSVYPAAQVCGVMQARLRDRRLQTLLHSLRARGLGAVRIWLGHVLRVVAPPLVTVIGSTFGALLGGAVLTETVFSWPGIGRYLVEAVLGRDLYAVQNVLLQIILLVVVVATVADLLAGAINPLATSESEDEKR